MDTANAKVFLLVFKVRQIVIFTRYFSHLVLKRCLISVMEGVDEFIIVVELNETFRVHHLILLVFLARAKSTITCSGYLERIGASERRTSTIPFIESKFKF